MKRHLLFLAALGMLALPLAACEKSDTDTVIDFMNDWMKNKGILDDKGNPTVKAGLVATGWGSTGDDQVDAAVQAGYVVKGMADTDKLVADAGKDMGKNDKDAALKKMNEAVAARPNDWYYLNRRAAVEQSMGNTTAANKDLQAAIAACDGNTYCLAHAKADAATLGSKTSDF